jgi:hypothetical protein
LGVAHPMSTRAETTISRRMPACMRSVRLFLAEGASNIFGTLSEGRIGTLTNLRGDPGSAARPGTPDLVMTTPGTCHTPAISGAFRPNVVAPSSHHTGSVTLRALPSRGQRRAVAADGAGAAQPLPQRGQIFEHLPLDATYVPAGPQTDRAVTGGHLAGLIVVAGRPVGVDLGAGATRSGDEVGRAPDFASIRGLDAAAVGGRGCARCLAGLRLDTAAAVGAQDVVPATATTAARLYGRLAAAPGAGRRAGRAGAATTRRRTGPRTVGYLRAAGNVAGEVGRARRRHVRRGVDAGVGAEVRGCRIRGAWSRLAGQGEEQDEAGGELAHPARRSNPGASSR